MNQNQIINKNIETIGWAAAFIWWGITELLQTLPVGSGALGIGVILLSLNLVRFFLGAGVNGFSTAIGAVALLLGALDLAKSVFNISIQIPVFPILLIACGAITLLALVFRKDKNERLS